MCVQSLGWEDFLEKEMEYPEKEIKPICIPAWKIPQIEGPGRLQSTGSESQTRLSEWVHVHTHTSLISNVSAIYSGQCLRKTPRKKNVSQANVYLIFWYQICDVKCMCPFGQALLHRYVLKIILDAVVRIFFMKLTFKSIDFE